MSLQNTQAVSASSNFSHSPSESQQQQSESMHDFSNSTPRSMIDPDTISLRSLPLSEAYTCLPSEGRNLLYSSYQDCINSYAASVPRKMRGRFSNQQMDEKQEDTMSFSDFEIDDAETIISEPKVESLMNSPIESYNSIRTLVLAKEMITNNMYVFSDKNSFDLFKKLKKSGKAFGLIGSQQHIISLDGSDNSGTPLLRVEVPFMSQFRRNTPYMIFRISPPSMEPELANDFCTVKLKSFYYFKRYTFEYKTSDGKSFRVLAFQNNFRPYTDFNYNGTRFRIFGTSRSVAYPTHYNPELKLCILDDEQYSLAENLGEKKSSSMCLKKRKNVDSFTEERDLKDPVPNPEHPLIKQIIDDEYSSFYKDNVPQKLPPLGKFLDSWVTSQDSSVIPKRYTEVGNFAVFEDDSEQMRTPVGQPIPVHLNSLVLTTIMMALRETGIRTTVRYDEIRGLMCKSPLI